MNCPRLLRISAGAIPCSGLTAGILIGFPFQDDDDNVAGQVIPNTGQRIKPLAPRGARFKSLSPGLTDFPKYAAGQAVTTVVSPDKRTLLVLTSGYNLLNATSGATLGQQSAVDSNQYIFVYSIVNKVPVKSQVLRVPNNYNGLPGFVGLASI